MVVRINTSAPEWRILQPSVVKWRYGSVTISSAFLTSPPPWSLVIFLNHNFLLKLTFDTMNFEQKNFCINHLRLLSHSDQVWKIFQLDLRYRVRAKAFLILFEDLLQLLQFDFQDLNMIDIFVTLLLELIYLGSKLPLIFLTIFNLSDTTKRPWRLWELRHVLARVLHYHIVAVLDHGVRLIPHHLLLLWVCTSSSTFLHLYHYALLLDGLRVGCDATHLCDPLLFYLTLSWLHLLHKHLRLQIVWLHLANVLLMCCMPLLGNLWVLLLLKLRAVWADLLYSLIPLSAALWWATRCLLSVWRTFFGNMSIILCLLLVLCGFLVWSSLYDNFWGDRGGYKRFLFFQGALICWVKTTWVLRVLFGLELFLLYIFLIAHDDRWWIALLCCWCLLGWILVCTVFLLGVLCVTSLWVSQTS